MIKRQSYFLIAFGIIYGIINYLAVKSSGKPLYWFLTWQDYWSVIYLSIIIGVFTSLFLLTAVIDETITGRSASKRRAKLNQLGVIIG